MKPIHSQARIGHVHLKVSDLERSLGFYRDVLGFEVTARIGHSAAFLSAGGYHHHIGLNTWESLGGSPPPAGATGLYHVAILYPTRAELADALRRLIDANVPLDGASDHGVSEAIYLRDPDDNGVELYCDRPMDAWPRTAAGVLAMTTEPLDLQALLRETSSGERLDQPDVRSSRERTVSSTGNLLRHHEKVLQHLGGRLTQPDQIQPKGRHGCAQSTHLASGHLTAHQHLGQ